MTSIQKAINVLMTKLAYSSDFPVFNRETLSWYSPEFSRHPMKLYVETLEGTKLPLVWVFYKIIKTDVLVHPRQIENSFFKKLGFKTGTFLKRKASTTHKKKHSSKHRHKYKHMGR